MAKQVLDKAFKGDPFNRPNVNTLDLLDKFTKFRQVRYAAFQSEAVRNRSRGHAALCRGTSREGVRHAQREVWFQARRPDHLRDVSGPRRLRRANSRIAGDGRRTGSLFWKTVRDGFAGRSKARQIQLGQYAVARVYARHHASDDGSQNSALVFGRTFGLRGAQCISWLGRST